MQFELDLAQCKSPGSSGVRAAWAIDINAHYNHCDYTKSTCIRQDCRGGGAASTLPGAGESRRNWRSGCSSSRAPAVVFHMCLIRPVLSRANLYVWPNPVASCRSHKVSRPMPTDSIDVKYLATTAGSRNNCCCVVTVMFSAHVDQSVLAVCRSLVDRATPVLLSK